jgi:hypothetical protein
MNLPEPNAEVKAAMHAAIEARGWIVNSYAQFENLLSDLVQKARDLPEYADLSVPFRTSTRIARTRELLSRCGPLSAHSSEIAGLLDRFQQFEDTRMCLVHGYMTVQTSRRTGAVQFRFEYYRREPGGGTDCFERIFGPADLENEMERFVAFATDAMSAFRGIHIAMGWAGP